MRALEVSYPWGTANLNLVERPDPQPGRGEVVVRMRTTSLNFRDAALMVLGRGAGEGSPPYVPFSDGCGIIEAVGKGVDSVSVGDRVSTVFYPNWDSGESTPEKLKGGLGQHGVPGAGRNLALFAENAVIKVPDYLTDQEVGTLACAALTAWRGLFVDARLQPGDTVVLQGTGGVSIFGLQFARAAGYRTIITSSSDEKLERARGLGADVLINYRSTPEWHAPVREATAGRGADLVLEVGGAGTLDESLKSIRIGGHIAIIGAVTGIMSKAELSPMALFGTSAKLQGLSVGSREMYAAMLRAMAHHQIRPEIDRVLPWTEAARAVNEMQANSHFGKIVLTID
jgi:NADPH:quinone reductase-like Zn-dependent oxidoreductase